MTFELSIPAPDGDRFTAGAFVGQEGREVDVVGLDGVRRRCRIDAARVSDDGGQVWLTLTTPADLVGTVRGHAVGIPGNRGTYGSQSPDSDLQ